MKKPRIPILVILTLIFAAFICGFYTGRSCSAAPVTVSVPASLQTLPPETTSPAQLPTEAEQTVTFPIDINLATKEEFMALPGIGDVLAQRILDYREEYGPFTNVDALLNVEGMGKKRMEKILTLITIGG